ncbi:MAG: type I 3-dehydroquinate dehydratase [Synergistetes bacterium]|nr:type I 3-dehydroquinate dehydratase [Synergistota bacterium]
MRLACRTPLNIKGKMLGGDKPLICVPLVAKDKEEILRLARDISAHSPDLIELRIDYWDFLEDVSETIEVISILRRELPSLPFILTCRDHKEGGVKEVDLRVKEEIYIKAIENRLVDLVDIELSMGVHFIERIKRKARENGVFIILSYHDFNRPLSEDEIFAKIFQEVYHGADIAKVGSMPQTYDDVLALLNATLRARKMFPDIPLITVAMGELGVFTRLVGFAWGSDLTFAMVSEASAPGQVSLPVLSEVFKVFNSLALWKGGGREVAPSQSIAA